MLIRSELMKMLTRRVMIFIVILLTVNFFVCFYYAHTEAVARKYDERSQYADAFAALEKISAENPEEAIAYYQTLKDGEAIAREEWNKHLSENTLHTELADLPFHYSSPSTLAEGYEDWALFDQYLNWVNDYPSILRDTVSRAEHNTNVLGVFGVQNNSPSGIYQQKLHDIYSDVLSKSDQTASMVYGWDEYFTYDYGFLFLALAIMIMAVQIALCDRESGMEVIIRTNKRGRMARGISQSLALLLAMLALTCLFKLTELSAVALRCGLSDPSRSIQNVRAFTYSPLVLSIAENALLQLALTFLSACTLAFFCMAITAFSKNVIATVVCGVVMIGINMFCYFFQSLFEWQSMNLLSLSYGEHFKSLPPIAFNQMGRSTLPFAVSIFLIAFAVLFVLNLLANQFVRPKLSIKPIARLFRNLSEVISAEKPKASIRAHSMILALLRGEARKHLSHLMVAVLILLIGLHIHQTLTALSSEMNAEEARLASYIEQYGQTVDEELLQRMNTKLEEYSRFLSDETEDAYRKDYLSGAITPYEYYAYKAERSRIEIALPAFKQMVNHTHYLLSLEEQGIETVLFNDYGYLTFFERGFDRAYYLIIIFLTASMFAVEYRHKFIDILRTTKHGRGRIMFCKYAFSMLVTVIVGIAFALYDFHLLETRYRLEGFTAPLVCIENYASFAPWITVGDYIMLCFIIRILAGILLATVITGLSALLPQVKFTLPIAVGITLLPHALTSLGLQQADLFDYTHFFDANRFMLKLTENGGWLYILLPIAYLILSVALFLAAKRKIIR